MRTFIVGIVLAVPALSLAAATADARTRSRTVSVQGQNGHGYLRQATVTRTPGHRSASRSLTTDSGRGVTSTRDRSVSAGGYQADVSHTTNGGTSVGRSTSVVANGDGSYDATITRDRADGSTATHSKTVTPH